MSEAGTPLVADPGYELGRAAIAAGCGSDDRAGGLCGAGGVDGVGAADGPVCFVGFSAAGKKQRETEIATLRDVPFTLVFYESPKRVGEMLANLRDILGDETTGGGLPRTDEEI